jgi:tetratricopeptide (TPR) repeat protein
MIPACVPVEILSMEQENGAKIKTVKELLYRLMDNKAWEPTLAIGEYLASLEPDGLLAWQAQGLAALNLHDLDKSEEYFQKALERGDTNPVTYFQLARIHAFRNDLNGKIFWLKKSLELDPEDVISLFNLALTHQTLGERDIAEEILKKIVEKHPDYVPAWRALSDLHRAAQNLDAAEQDLEKAIAADGRIGQLHADLAYILKERDQYDKALPEYFQALELNPDNPIRYYDIGDTFLALNENDRAISFLKKATEIDPENPLYNYDLGLAFFNAGRYVECEAANRTALMFDSQMRKARTNLGMSVTTNLGLAYLHLGKLKEGEQCFRQNLQLVASSYFNLGLALHWQGKYDEALTNFIRATELASDDSEYWDMVGNAWIELDDLDQAKEALDKAIALDQKYPLAQYDLGVVFSRQKGKEKEAMDQFNKAIAIDDAYPLPYYAIACLHALAGKKDLALETLRKAVDLGFSNREHADADHDLDSLREDPEFVEIMNRMDKKKDRSLDDSDSQEKEPVRKIAPATAKKGLGSSRAAYASRDQEEWQRYIW